MQFEKFIKDFYPTVDPYEGVNAIETRLLKHNYLVVMDEQRVFHGILTPADLIMRPHKIVIDCITKKENISFNDTTLEVVEKFRNSQCSALPVIHNDTFVGVIEKKQIMYDFEYRVDALQQRALISEKAKEHFLSNLSHEIRTPLNGIVGFVEIMSQFNNPDHDTMGYSFPDLIKSSADRFLLIMNDIMELSLLHAGDSLPVEITKISVEEILFDLKEFFENIIKSQHKEIKLICSVSVPAIDISSDEKKVKHILFHLIDNAIKFTANNEVKFGYERSDTLEYIELFVRNRFNGIFERDYFQIFEKQAVIGNELNSGLGIGLPLVKKLTELLGGSVNVKHFKREIEFRVRIPINP